MQKTHLDSPVKPFIVLSLPRTGSTSLSLLLNAHPAVRCALEPFHPNRAGGRFHRAAIESGDIQRVLRLLLTRVSGIKHVLEASGWPFEQHPHLNYDLLSGEKLTVVTLSRQNLLARVISNFLCRQTGYWIGTKEGFRHSLDSTRVSPISTLEVKRQIEQDQKEYANIHRYLRLMGIRHLNLVYEQLFSHNGTAGDNYVQVCRLFDFLSIENVSFSTFLRTFNCYLSVDKKWADIDTLKRIPNICEINRELGSDEFGWLW